MRCDQQRILLNEEHRAWSAYKVLQDSGSQDKEEITRRADDAALVSSRLWEHISKCRACRAPAVGRSRIASSCDTNGDFSNVRSSDLYATLGT